MPQQFSDWFYRQAACNAISEWTHMSRSQIFYLFNTNNLGALAMFHALWYYLLYFCRNQMMQSRSNKNLVLNRAQWYWNVLNYLMRRSYEYQGSFPIACEIVVRALKDGLEHHKLLGTEKPATNCRNYSNWSVTYCLGFHSWKITISCVLYNLLSFFLSLFNM